MPKRRAASGETQPPQEWQTIKPERTYEVAGTKLIVAPIPLGEYPTLLEQAGAVLGELFTLTEQQPQAVAMGVLLRAPALVPMVIALAARDASEDPPKRLPPEWFAEHCDGNAALDLLIMVIEDLHLEALLPKVRALTALVARASAGGQRSTS